MSEQEAVRQLVKSRPELWAQCSDAERLTRHLHSFGELRITRLEPESTVAWEGETASGTVTLEASGWGTRVRLTALPAGASGGPPVIPETPLTSVSAPPLSSVAAPPLVLTPRSLAEWFSAFLGRRGAPVPAAPPTPESAPPTPESGTPELRPAEPASADPRPGDLVVELEAALDSLGQAHHRPYSRA
jgi:hypothetical protein